jgi:hypothetical protein
MTMTIKELRIEIHNLQICVKQLQNIRKHLPICTLELGSHERGISDMYHNIGKIKEKLYGVTIGRINDEYSNSGDE